MAAPGQTFAVEDAIGFVGILGLEDDTPGYWFALGTDDQGFCTTALKRAFAKTALDEIRVGVWADNAASQAILARLGFKVAQKTFGCSAARHEDAAGFDLTLQRGDWANRPQL